ncbi:DUF4249 domain-containing protein [Spirosoma soli]|uniref:DUF4249 domain-containing protein n=1 Tax=Spirosoma soli TaxID=1770529 RepID=A0ABW5M485_9BACT
MRWWILVILTVSMVGCLKTTDEIDRARLSSDRDSKLYVVCFISPQDTILSAKVAMSEPKVIAAASPALLIKTATVTISDEEQSVTLPYDSAVGYYRANPAGKLAIRAGRTYRLTVLMDENRRVTAQATVPVPVQIQRVQVDSTVAITGSNQFVLYTTTIYWNSPGGLNYYRGWGQFTQTIRDNKPGQPDETRISQPSFFVDREDNVGPSLRSVTGTHTLLAPAPAQIRTKAAHIGLFNTDVNYYRYHTTLREQLSTPNNSLAETTGLFSNIDGGYGVFAAYNATYVVVR